MCVNIFLDMCTLTCVHVLGLCINWFLVNTVQTSMPPQKPFKKQKPKQVFKEQFLFPQNIDGASHQNKTGIGELFLNH